MTDQANVSIVGAGMVTAVGFNFASSSAAIRAGIKGLRKANLWDAENGAYLVAAKVDLPQWWEGVGKLADLVAPAIWECLMQAAPERPEAIPILLGIAPRDRPGRLANLEAELLDEIEWRLELRHHAESGYVPLGNVSGLVALDHARKLLAEGRARFCIVAGVDSFLQQDVVEAYMQQQRVMTKTNSNGFFPGEAGGALLVGHAGSGSDQGELHVRGIGFGVEAATIGSEEPLKAKGLTEACRNALAEAHVTLDLIDYRNTDLNGEQYKFKEAAFMKGRLMPKRKERQEIWHLAECIGEIGAAYVPCVLATSLQATRKDYSPGSPGLCHFSGDGPERGACVIESTWRSQS